MSFPRYERYKDSGVEWLGEVPEGWLVSKLGYRLVEAPCYGVLVPDFDPDGIPMMKIMDMESGKVDRDELTRISQSLSDQYSRTITDCGDVLLSVLGTIGEVVIVDDALAGVNLSRAICRLQLGEDVVDRYLAYALKSDVFKCYVDLVCVGSAQRVLNMFDLSALKLTFPDIEAQLLIADFLDVETSKIDTLISEQQKLIELLKEKRQAVISHAVTKGLNPQVKMKDSGVEWLGEVPEHWGITRLKHATSVIVDCPHETPVYDDDGDFMVIRTADVFEGVLNVDKIYRVSKDEYINRIRRQSLLGNDIVYGREGERWGFAACVPEDDSYCLGQRMMQFRANGFFCSFFLMWQLNSISTYRQGEMDTVGATSPHVNVGTIRNYALTEPPLQEQQLISEYIRRQVAMQDSLISEAQKAITLLQERRSALISAAVTGKIDVRNVHTPETAHA